MNTRVLMVILACIGPHKYIINRVLMVRVYTHSYSLAQDLINIYIINRGLKVRGLHTLILT